MITEYNTKGIALEDSTFKFLFYRKDLLKDFLDSYFRFIKVKKHVYLNDVLTHNHIMKDKIKLKDFYADVLATLNTNEIVILEAYTNFGREEYAKSFSYMSRIYANQIKSGNSKYKDNKKVICLNLMHGNYRRCNSKLVNRYEMMNNLTFKVLDSGEMEMVLINLDMISNLPYTESEERFNKWLRFLSAKSLDELEKVSKGDDVLMESAEYIKWYINSENNTCLEDKIREATRKTVEETERKSLMNTAKNMLIKGISIEDTQEITGLPLKEITKLKKSI